MSHARALIMVVCTILWLVQPADLHLSFYDFDSRVVTCEQVPTTHTDHAFRYHAEGQIKINATFLVTRSRADERGMQHAMVRAGRS